MYDYLLHQKIKSSLLKFRIGKNEDNLSFYSRLIANGSTIQSLYNEIYKHHPKATAQFDLLIDTITSAHKKRKPALKKTDAAKAEKGHWFLSNEITGMSLYVDQFCGSLTNLGDKLSYFDKLGVNFLHLMPLFESPAGESDGGYAVSDFRKINSRLQGHPATHEHLPGIRIASGSLGQGMSVAIGAALAKKLNNDKNVVFSLHGDGELDEGQNWEAIMFAAHHKVDNLISTVDWNGQQIDGTTANVMNLGNLDIKFAAFGWEVIHLENGNDINAVVDTLEKAKTFVGKGKPIAILMKTVMGSGVDFMEGHHEWHGVAPNDDQLAKALAQLPETLGDY